MSFDIREHNLPLPKGWSYKKISDVARVNANTIRKKDAPDEIYYIDISSVSNGSFEPPKHMLYADAPSRAKRIVKKNDFIISTVRPNLKQYVFLDEVHENWIASTGFAVITAIEAGTEWYLYSVITSELFNEHLVRVADGGAYPAFNPKEIEDAVIFWPDEDSLRVINDLAFNLNTKQKNNTQTNQALEQIAQAIFKSWFVDFDPVKAKIETLAAGGSAEDAELAAMRVISAKTLDELNSLKTSNPEAFNKLAQTAALFPAAMQDSELGEIPEGWSVEQLGDHLNVLQTGSRPKGGVGGITEGVPSVGAENILGVGKYTYGKEKFVSREFFDKLKRGVVEDFDFLLYKDGGKPGEFKPRVSMFGCGFPYSEFAINEHVFRMRSESLGQAFLYFQIGHKRVLDELANRGGKAAIPGINQTDVKTIPVLVPGAADLLTEFNEFAQKIIESILKKSNESNHLVSIRDTLLPKLLNGEIDLTSEVVE